jgi:hypothetical protein
MAYDAARGKVVLFGGGTASGFSNETWEWNGTSWMLITPVTSPPARRYHSLVYDQKRAKVVLFGGVQTWESNDVWEWDGTNWVLKEPQVSPPVRKNHAAAHDTARGRMVLFGGNNSIDMNDTWEWNGGADERPGQTAAIAFRAAGLSVVSGVTFQSLDVLFKSGGRGWNAGVTTNGASLSAWSESTWKSLTSNGAAPETTADLKWSVTDNAEIYKLLNSGMNTFSFAVTPSYPNGTLADMGEITTDYLEVTVRYTLP